MSIVKDISLAPSGLRKIQWVRDFMPALSGIEERFRREKPFAGLTIAVSVHLEAKTANLGLVLRERLDRQASFAMAVVLAIGVPFFLPHMHERYFFLADMLTLCWACMDRRRIPVCVLAAGSSLACYIVYLRLKYSVIVTVGGQRFVMAVEAAMMLAALVLAAVELARQLRRCLARARQGEGAA